MILNSPSQATKTNHQSQGSTHKTLATQPTTQIFRLGLINVLRKYYEARTLSYEIFFLTGLSVVGDVSRCVTVAGHTA